MRLNLMFEVDSDDSLLQISESEEDLDFLEKEAEVQTNRRKSFLDSISMKSLSLRKKKTMRIQAAKDD